MADLSSVYLGLSIKSPVVVGASNMVNDLDNLKRMEEAGAGAIVYKSLFEEQIQLESYQLQDELEEYNERHAEMVKLFPSLEHAGPEEHLHNLRKAKESVSIPVIASLNAIYKETWLEYAGLIAETGVDALELNFYSVPREMNISGDSIEKSQIEILKAIKKTVKIPVSVKLSPFYANPLQFIGELDKAGANGVVLFNRLFQPDINIETLEHHTPFSMSSEGDNLLSLRFAGLLFGNISSDIIANTGILSGADVAKAILAGANNVQIVSTLYKNKISYLKTILADLNVWMDSKGYKKLNDFRGNLSKKQIADPFIYKRAQYIDLLLRSHELTKTYSLR